MKQIEAFMHHVRSADVVRALADAGFRNLVVHDVRGMLKALCEDECDYSHDMAGFAIAEVRLMLVCADQDVDSVVSIIRTVARIGPHISGWVYVSPVELALPIGGD